MKQTARLSTVVASFLDRVPGPVVELSREGRVRFVNQSMANLLGYSKEEMRGKSWFAHFIPAETRSQQVIEWKKVLSDKAGQQEWRTMNYVETKNGALHLVDWKTTIRRGKRGLVNSVFLAGKDRTDEYLMKIQFAEQMAKCRKDRLKAILDATDRERQLLAYELHDGVNQVLTTCKLLLESELAKNPGAEGVRRVAGYIQEVINTIRGVAHNLNPADLGKEALYDAAREMVSRVNETGRLQVRLKMRGLKHLRHLPSTAGLTLYRIMQEALNNILRHAGASNAMIALTGSHHSVDMEIRDNGKGFEQCKKRKGLGLKTIHTRAEVAGGRAYIESVPGKGTLLSIHIPLHPTAAFPD